MKLGITAVKEYTLYGYDNKVKVWVHADIVIRNAFYAEYGELWNIERAKKNLNDLGVS